MLIKRLLGGNRCWGETLSAASVLFGCVPAVVDGGDDVHEETSMWIRGLMVVLECLT